MSTKGSIVWHWNEADRIQIHIFEEVFEDPPHNVYLEVRTEHAEVRVPWPVGLTQEDVRKLAISAASAEKFAAKP